MNQIHNYVNNVLDESNIGNDITQLADKIVKFEEIFMKMSNNLDHVKIGEKFGEMKEGMAKMMKIFEELKEEIIGMNAEKRFEKLPKLTFRNQIMPAELLNELFASLALKNAFRLLAKMPNGLLAKNVQKTINGIKEALKENKWNKLDCGTNLTISKNELVLTKQSSNIIERNCVRAIHPIPPFNFMASMTITKPIIVYYYEVKILKNSKNGWKESITIEFCKQQFSLDNKEDGSLGFAKNSIGISSKSAIMFEGFWKYFGKDNGYFKKGDSVGIGIIYQSKSKLECFSTCNDKLLGKIELPTKFAKIQLFPAINLSTNRDSIRVNFGKEKWQFKEFGRVLK